ncbi:hypothetical protein INT47_003022 [Mucor saturninus]|uniref:Uncharacterized protein n=1 Tax=Mucor saturninus TaxID=64648 RepID=A0A8H7V1R0_9FUNG|nr:hypothetical protein INT47_003022 [Mucor saturninus]
MAKNTASQKAEEIESKIDSGASELQGKVREGAKKVDEVLENEDVKRATKRAEDEVNRLKAELAEFQRKAGPKLQEAEHFLCSPTAITFYKGLVTGVALVLAYKKYAEKRF